VGLQGPEGAEVAKDILRQYETMRADLRFFPRIRLDLGAFANTTQFGLPAPQSHDTRGAPAH